MSVAPGRVRFGRLVRSDASDTHVLVWAANAANFQGAAGDRIDGGGLDCGSSTFTTPHQHIYSNGHVLEGKGRGRRGLYSPGCGH